ncbi:MAG: hypothetical protein ACI3W5_16590 [Faecousia sp.]
MSDKLQPQPQNKIIPSVPGTTHNIGSIDTFVANAGQVQNNYIFSSSGMPGAGMTQNFGAPPQMDTGYYNLFVLPFEAFISGGFRVQKIDALKDTEENVVKDLTLLGERELSCIRSYPTIVAMPNIQYGTTAPGSIVHYGFLNSIQVCETSVIFGFTKLQDIPQNILVDNAAIFGIGKACAYNEFDHPHWAVKHINVVEALRNQGVQVIVFSY